MRLALCLGAPVQLTRRTCRNCLFLIENIFSLRIESMSRHRRALLLHSAAFTTGFGGPVGCFMYTSAPSAGIASCDARNADFGYCASASSAARHQRSSSVCAPRSRAAPSQCVSAAFDFPAWTGPTLVIIMFYFIFTVAIYRLLGDVPTALHFALLSLTSLLLPASDISLSVHAYVNSRSRLVLSNITPAERFIQVTACSH